MKKLARLESIGKRIARLRQEAGLTQQALAERLGVSRVAVSHIEMDLSLPSERTITLLAGVFKFNPYALVQDTTYPEAKAERLPPVAPWYTPLEMDLALLENDLTWLERLDEYADQASWRWAVWEKWQPRLQHWERERLDGRARESISSAQHRLAASCHPNGGHPNGGHPNGGHPDSGAV